MTDRSDHLIERAAAMLRAGATPRPAATPPTEPTPAAHTVPPAPPPPSPAAAGRPSTLPPRLVPPPRQVPLVAAPPPPARSANVLSVSGNVADIRALSTHPPISLAMLERAGLMVARSIRTRTTEEYRIVIGRVLRALHEEPEEDAGPPGELTNNVVMITSARPGEGKSFTALNLGGSIAQNAGESVLVVDVDAKNGSLSDQLGLSENLGFFDLVSNPDLALEDVIVQTELANLFFLPFGTKLDGRLGDEDDASAPEERRLTPPILRLSQRFPRSLIVLDAPPCLSTSDPHTLAPVVAQVLMVVEAERTQRNEVEAAIDLVRVCPMVTMLLNKVRMSTSHTFGSYDYFGSYT